MDPVVARAVNSAAQREHKHAMHPRPPRLIPVAAVTAILLLASACGSSTESPDASTAQESTPATSSAPSDGASAAASAAASTSAGEETSVFDLEVGDCFSAEGESASTVSVVDCSVTHVYEVFFVFDHEATGQDPFPGDEEISSYADERCEPPFEEYVGNDYDTSIYWITSVTPSDETWAEGDREIVCTLRLGEDGEPTTGSAEGAGE